MGLWVSFLGVNKRWELKNKIKVDTRAFESMMLVNEKLLLTKIGSLMKKIGVLLPTKSQLPSSV